MENLIVVYDKEIEDKGRDSYIKAIKRQIPDAIIADVNKDGFIQDPYKVLFLKPLDENTARNAVRFLERHPRYDVEGVATGRLTITAEAIIRVIGPVDKKTVVIINQSDVLGIPLAKELIERGANVISLNSSYPCIDNLLTMTDIDVLVSASNNSDFTIDRFLTKDIKIKIDLFEDIDDPNKITRVPTIEVLKDRLENSNKWWEQNND
ncbi:hypothetical protein [Peptoniphilus genitalis]|uniref:hypothetical protein n=1 Tax=Peptoniphilus genitalis TaxID=3036303 RepID=UPI0024ACA61E|nr:hypothetical protein [Peptoniphilus sp. Marseille-Q7072]